MYWCKYSKKVKDVHNEYTQIINMAKIDKNTREERTEVTQISISPTIIYEMLDKIDLLLAQTDNKKKEEDLPEYLQVEDVARILCKSPHTIRRMVEDKRLKAEPRERRCKILISREELTRYKNKLLKKEGR